MRTNNLFASASTLLLVVAFVLFGCSDQVPAPVLPSDVEELSPEIPQEVLDEIAELERIAEAPDGGVSYWFSKDDHLVEGNHLAVELPPGSVDALADTIAAVGSGGVVRVRSGMHTESGTVTITDRVNIVGESGAVLQVDTNPIQTASSVEPALHVLNANRVVIWGLEIVPANPIGGTAILVEDSRKTLIGRNTMRDHEISILLEHGDKTTIWRNNIMASTAWQTGDIGETFAVVVMNGEKVRVVDNQISDGLFGLWACDRKGYAFRNDFQANYIGLILCKVPDMAYPLPSGELAGSERSATKWLVRDNEASGNFDAGYLVIDGANRNLLTHNAASNNGTYDIELVGDSYRFGFLTPMSYDNKVNAGPPSILVKDCGLNNTVHGGTLVDNTVDPCF